MNNFNKKFKGGVWIGALANTWPFGALDIDQNRLILCDKLFKKEIIFPKQEIKRIEIKKYLPIIGYGIRIYSKNPKQNDLYCFWYVGFHFSEFTNKLKGCGYL